MPAANPILREPSLPRLPEADHALFNLYASVHLDIHALADKSGRDLAELTAWAAAPEIRLWTEAYREVAGHALLHAATAALVESIRLTNDPVEKRRAATALIRAHHGGTPLRGVRNVTPSAPSKASPGRTESTRNDPPRAFKTAPAPAPPSCASDDLGYSIAIAQLHPAVVVTKPGLRESRTPRRGVPPGPARLIAAAGLAGPAP
jgi:hypothetical protein